MEKSMFLEGLMGGCVEVKASLTIAAWKKNCSLRKKYFENWDWDFLKIAAVVNGSDDGAADYRSKGPLVKSR